MAEGGAACAEQSLTSKRLPIWSGVLASCIRCRRVPTGTDAKSTATGISGLSANRQRRGRRETALYAGVRSRREQQLAGSNGLMRSMGYGSRLICRVGSAAASPLSARLAEYHRTGNR